ncbi:MAG: TonB-dependent receptor plug domain-containing protein, partial [Verrucomicrobiota bacterium]
MKHTLASPICALLLASLAFASFNYGQDLEPEAVTDTAPSELAETVVTATEPAPAPAPQPSIQFRSEPAPRPTSSPAAAPTAAVASPEPPAPLLIEDATQTETSFTILPASGNTVLQIDQAQDVVAYAPNQYATDSGSRSFGDVYSARGLTNTVFFGAPGTTIYVDDVPFGETFTYAQDLGPVQSVEVFRGPQPTLVGRNAYGGLINITSERPTDEFQGSASYSYSSFDTHETDLHFSGPVNEVVSYRVGGYYNSSDGFLINSNTGNPVDFQENWGLNGTVFIRPNQDLEISLSATYDEFDDGAPTLTSLDRTTGFYTVGSDVVGQQFRKTNSQALRIAYEAPDYKFLSVSSHRGFDLDPYIIDLDFTAAPFG